MENSKDKFCIVAGMPRAATTYLYHVLAEHPEAFVPARKELEFYSLNYSRQRSWYESFFSEMQSHQTGFDISPMYFLSDLALDRIVNETSHSVVLMVRKPSEFVISLYKNRLAGDPSCPSFEAFLAHYVYEKDNEKLEIDVAPGQIRKRIERFKKELGARLLLVDYKQVDSDPVSAIQQIEKFTGLGSYFGADNLSTDKVNGSDQQASKLVYYLMHQKWFADLIPRLVPKPLILYLRLKLQSAQRSKPLIEHTQEKTYQEMAEKLFADDDAYVEELFSQNERDGQVATNQA